MNAVLCCSTVHLSIFLKLKKMTLPPREMGTSVDSLSSVLRQHKQTQYFDQKDDGKTCARLQQNATNKGNKKILKFNKH